MSDNSDAACSGEFRRLEGQPNQPPSTCEQVASAARFLEANLVEPGTGERLRIAGNEMLAPGGRTYRFTDGIPCFVSTEKSAAQLSELEHTVAYVNELLAGRNSHYSPLKPYVQPRACWEWVEPWLNAETVTPRSRIVCIGGSFADDLPHIASDYKFNIDALACEYQRLMPQIAAANTHYVACQAESLPFADGYADVVYTRNSLDHVHNPLVVLREMHRVLKPEGQLFVAAYYNSTFLNEHESTVIDEDFIHRGIEPLFSIVERTVAPAPQQSTPNKARTGFIHLVCTKLSNGCLPFSEHQIQTVGEILACFHAALFAEHRGNQALATTQYQKLLRLEPVLAADVHRFIYALIRLVALTEPAKLAALAQAFREQLPEPFWLEAVADVASQKQITLGSRRTQPIALAEELNLPCVIRGRRVLTLLRQGQLQTVVPAASRRAVGPSSGTDSALLMVVFSKDRPLQLDATLRSFTRHCRDAGKVALRVLYAASTSRLRSLYRQVLREHPNASLVAEGDFRRDLLVLLSEGDFGLFVVDDTLFVRDFALGDLAAALHRHPDALGCSLRLGRNTTFCYPLNQAQQVPECQPVTESILKYWWPGADHDFGYPLELSSSLYRLAYLRPMFEELAFRNPNTLEALMAACAARYRESYPTLLCPSQSLAFCAPVNLVQQVCANRVGGNRAYSPESLAQQYAAGWRLDVAAYDGFTPNACHQEVELKLARTHAAVPLVSVIIPCYQQAQFLRAAVASVVAQTFTDWELIIVNDGSPDDTSAVARELIAANPQRAIRLVEKPNGGLAEARNAGIRAAHGAYILPLDADDLLQPTMLEKAVALLEANADVAIAYTDVTHFGAENRTIQAAEYDPVGIRANNQLNYCSLYRREAWERCGGYNANLVWGYEDWDFWLSCTAQGLRAQRIPEPLLRYRVKESSMFTTAVQHDQELRARIIGNHPDLYDARSREHAAAVLATHPLPPPPGAPKVSVIVSTCNRPAMLQEALHSILAQTCREVEILVVNDAGIEVGAWIQILEAPLPIRCFTHPKNRGLAAARNTGLRAARGKYIAYLDDDDIFLPNHLQTLVEFLESTGTPVAYTDARCAFQECVGGRYVIQRREVVYSSDWDNDRILVQNMVPVLCVMHERACLDQTGYFDESLTTHEDWEFWIRLSRHYPFHHLPHTTAEFRARTDGSSMTSGRRKDFLRTARMIYKKHRAPTKGKREIVRRRRKFQDGLAAQIAAVHPPTMREWLQNWWWRRFGC